MADVEQADGLEFFRTPPRRSARRLLPVVGPYLDEMAATRDRLRQLVRTHRPDVIHAHSPVLNVLPALTVGRVGRRAGRLRDPRLLGRRGGRPRNDHGGQPALPGDARTRNLRSPACPGHRRDLRRAAARRGGARHSARAHHGHPECRRRRPVRVQCRRPMSRCARNSASRARLVLGFLGSFYAYEGLDLLLEALPQLLPRASPRSVAARGGRPGGGGPQGAGRRAGRRGCRPVHRPRPARPGRPLLLAGRPAGLPAPSDAPDRPRDAVEAARGDGAGSHRRCLRRRRPSRTDCQTGRRAFCSARATRPRWPRACAKCSPCATRWDAMRLRARRFVEEQRSWKRSVAGYEALYDRVCGRSRLPAPPVPAFESHAEAVPR